VEARHVAALTALAGEHDLPCEAIGTVGGDRLLVELAGAGATGASEERGSGVADAIDVDIEELRRAWEHGLPRALGWDDGTLGSDAGAGDAGAADASPAAGVA
jgi:hypothetical protein